MKFYDTSALLDLPPDTLLAEPFLIADITLYELEDIKTSGKKDEATKAKARTVTRLLAEHPAAYTVVSIDYHQLFSILMMSQSKTTTTERLWLLLDGI